MEKHLVAPEKTLRSSASQGVWSEGGPAKSSVSLALNGQLVAVFILTDQIRRTSFSAMHSLRALGINVELLTGDRPEAA
ncbi:MAG: HAD family hydrolase, partial [Verrucomicrobia bacterium]|nr:HAD family hydrolase [Verrucomicrobiota bacterium]